MSQSFNAGDLGLTLGRTTTVPTTVTGLIAGLRDNVRNWVTLASAKRENGGEITAVARTAARYASELVDSHGADGAAVADSIRSRSILTLTDNAAVAAFYPDAYTHDADTDELTAIPSDADPSDAPDPSDTDGDGDTDGDAPDPTDAPDAPDTADADPTDGDA